MITGCFYQAFFRMRTSLSVFLNIGQLHLQCVYQGERVRRNGNMRLALVGVYPYVGVYTYVGVYPLTEGSSFRVCL